MFKILLSFLGDWAGKLFWFFGNLWKQFAKLINSVWTIVVGIVVGIVHYVLVKISTWVADIVAMVDTMIFPPDYSGQTLSTIGNLLNTFFPLNETFVFMMSFAALLGVLTLYRLIKTWIPKWIA